MNEKIKWYTEKELYSWLLKNKYNKQIASELVPLLLKNYNSAFKKGVEVALRGFINSPDEPPEFNKEVLLFVNGRLGTKRTLGYRSNDRSDPENINGWVMDHYLDGKVIAWCEIPDIL